MPKRRQPRKPDLGIIDKNGSSQAAGSRWDRFDSPGVALPSGLKQPLDSGNIEAALLVLSYRLGMNHNRWILTNLLPYAIAERDQTCGGSDPQRAVSRFGKRLNRVAGKPLGSRKPRKVLPVKPIEPRFGAQPEKTFPALDHTPDRRILQAI